MITMKSRSENTEAEQEPPIIEVGVFNEDE